MATPLTYRQWLQLKANDTDPNNAWDRSASSALLQVVGDDGKLNGYAVAENRAVKGVDGTVYKTAGTEGNLKDPAKGLMDVNDALLARYNNYTNSPDLIAQYNQENQGYATGGGSAPVSKLTSAGQQAKQALANRTGDIDRIYQSLYADNDKLRDTSKGQIQDTYNTNFKNASDSLAAQLPAINDSYYAMGSGDSTWNAKAQGDAQTAYDKSVADLATTRDKDLQTLGDTYNANKAEIDNSSAAARRYAAAGANSDSDSDAISNWNAFDSALTDADTTTRAKLNAGNPDNLVKPSGNYQAIADALKGLFASSIPYATKQAAVQAAGEAGGLSDDEKKKLQEQYGDAYSAQANA